MASFLFKNTNIIIISLITSCTAFDIFSILNSPSKPRRRISQIDLDYFDPAYCPEEHLHNSNDPRRLQFGTTASGTPSPTNVVTLAPTPDASTLYVSDTEPYILVDFNNHVSWDYANSYCVNELNSTLASVWDNRTTRINESAQIDLMSTICAGDGTEAHPGAVDGSSCWFGLRFYNDGGEYFEWNNGQLLDPDSETNWEPGTDVPTAFYFQLMAEDTVSGIYSVAHSFVYSVHSQPLCALSVLCGGLRQWRR